MKPSPLFLLMLLLCYLCRAQTHSGDDDVSLQAVENREERVQTPRPGTRGEGGEQELVLSGIFAELIDLRNRVTAAESLVEELQVENIAMKARMTTAESLVEELQMENDVREVAFSASLLTSGQGITNIKIENCSATDPLTYRNVIANTGNHYNPNTGYFTAPVRGMYYFTFTGHIAHSEDESMRLRLIKNNHIVVFAGDRHTTTNDVEDNASNGAVVQLEVGDLVWVQLCGSVWDDQYHRTTFSGFLLFPLSQITQHESDTPVTANLLKGNNNNEKSVPLKYMNRIN